MDLDSMRSPCSDGMQKLYNKAYVKQPITIGQNFFSSNNHVHLETTNIKNEYLV